MSPAGRVASDFDGPIFTPLFALVTASGLFYFMGVSTLLPVLPRYVEDELAGGGLAVGIVVGAFAFTAAGVRPLVGRLGDQWGRRAMALAGSLGVAVATLPLGAVAAVWWLVALRLAMGLGEAAFFVGSATAAQDLAPDHRRGEAASLYSTAIYAGLAVGPVLGERVYRHWDANAAFLVSGGLCLVSAAIAWGIPKELGQQAGQVDRRGGFFHPASVPPGVVLMLGMFSLAAFITFMPLYIDEVGTDDAGQFFLVYGLIVLAVRIFGAKIPDRVGAVRASSAALVMLIAGMAVVAAAPTIGGLWAGTVLFSLGMSLLFPALFSLAVNRAPASERSHAVGTFSLFFDLSQGVGAPMLGFVVAQSSERGAFVGAAVACAVGLVVSQTRLGRATTPADDARLDV